MKILKRVLLRFRARKAGRAYASRRGCFDPKSHKPLIRYLRLTRGYPAFQRSIDLSRFSDTSANHLEVWWLTTRRPIAKCPHYLLALLQSALEKGLQPKVKK